MPSSRPGWAKGGGPVIAGPPGKRWERPGPQPALPGSAPNARGRQPDAGKAREPRAPRPAGGRRAGFAAAGLVFVAAFAGLIGGRLGQNTQAPPAESSATVPPGGQQAPQAGIPSATLAQIYEKVAPSVVQVIPAASGGESAASGLILDEEGTILTSNEVASRGELSVLLPDGQRIPASVAGTDPQRNLAALRLAIPVPGLVAAQLGDSDSISVGDPVAAIGAPFGLDRSLTSGVVSALGRNFAGEDNMPPLQDVIQSDAPINRGAFGGPLVNEAGEVVGINMAIESPVGAFVGVGFAVPINQAKGDLLERIQEV